MVSGNQLHQVRQLLPLHHYCSHYLCSVSPFLLSLQLLTSAQAASTAVNKRYHTNLNSLTLSQLITTTTTAPSSNVRRRWGTELELSACVHACHCIINYQPRDHMLEFISNSAPVRLCALPRYPQPYSRSLSACTYPCHCDAP
jgi:hypothetical protein